MIGGSHIFFFSPFFLTGSGWSYWKGRVVGVMQQDVLNTTESPKFQPSCDFCTWMPGKYWDRMRQVSSIWRRSPFNSADARQYAGGRSCPVFICLYIHVHMSYIELRFQRSPAPSCPRAWACSFLLIWLDYDLTWFDCWVELIAGVDSVHGTGKHGRYSATDGLRCGKVGITFKREHMAHASQLMGWGGGGVMPFCTPLMGWDGMHRAHIGKINVSRPCPATMRLVGTYLHNWWGVARLETNDSWSLGGQKMQEQSWDKFQFGHRLYEDYWEKFAPDGQ